MNHVNGTIRPWWVRALGLALLSMTLSVFAWWPMISAFPNTQGGDGPPYHKTLEAARVTIVKYKEFPHWNVYECGGLPLWDNPQAPIGAPLVWPMFFIGTAKTMVLWYLVHSALGFVCMWLFARSELKLSRVATFVAAAAWAFSGFHQQHYSGGHFTFVPYLYFPLAILLWRRAEKSMRSAVLLGVLVAWMMYEGAVYPIPHLAVILFVETLMRTWPPKRLIPISKAALIVLLVGFGLGASRFLPVFDQLKSHTRPIGEEKDALQWETFKSMFLARTHDRFVLGQTYVWPEYGTYFGPILIVLALIGIVLCGFEQTWLLVLLVVSVVLMFGHAAKYAPWAFLKRHVFPFKEMRVPSRFRAEVSLFLAAFAGLAIDRLRPKLRSLLGRLDRSDAAHVAIASLALVGVGDMIAVGLQWFEFCFTNPPEATKVEWTPTLYFGGADMTYSMIDQPRQNRGRLNCWDEWGFGQGAPLWEGNVPQARAEGDELVVTNVSRTPNTFTLDVDAKAAGRVLLNGTYDRGWVTTVGKLAEQNKSLVLDLPPGKHHVKVRYAPRYFPAGVAITTGTALTLIAVVVINRRRRRASSPISTT